jgi:hypothetical protein
MAIGLIQHQMLVQLLYLVQLQLEIKLYSSDYKRTWGTNAITINPNSLNYQGNTSPNPVYNTSGQSVSYSILWSNSRLDTYIR